jgi:hypothetical protein
MRKPTLWILQAILGLTAVVLSSCGPRQPETLRMALLPVLDVLPFHVADQNGYFEELGVDVVLIPVKSAQERDTLMQAGEIDGMLTDLVSPLIASVRSLGAGRRAVFRFVYLPACLPAVLTSLRVSVGTAIAVLFFAESFATTSGLGYYIIVETWGRLDYAEMYAGVVAMSLLGLVLYFAVNILERRLCPWLAVS